MESPSKKVKIFGSIVVVGVLGTIFYPQLSNIPDMFSDNPSENLVDLTPISTTSTPGPEGANFFVKQEDDSDGDGLRDWEEELWRTNPELADTDGDGTADGVEVKKGRNPVVAGPSDIIVSGSTADFLLAQRTSSGPQPGNLSDSLSQGLFSTYVDGQENRISGDEQINQITSIAKNAVEQVRFQEFYSPKDFSTSPAGDLVSLKKYGNDLAQSQMNLIQALYTADGTATGNLTFLSIVYSNHTKNLENITVPQPLVDNHVTLINNFANLASNLYNVEEYDLDPAKAMFSLQQYDIIRVNAEKSLAGIGPFFRNSGIVFNENEPGSLWNQL